MAGGARRLRATRANPPGRASGQGVRRETYGAALQQFDELLAAAAAVGPVSRPLPLYYAMHQAGKAVAVAWTDEDVPVRGHGLTEDRASRVEGARDQLPEWRSDVLRFRVRPRKGEPGVFAAVASALGVARLTGAVELGALWSALPEVTPPPDASPWQPALRVSPERHEGRGGPFDAHVFRGIVWLSAQNAPADAAAVNRLLASYPGGVGAMALTYDGALIALQAERRTGVAVQWPRPEVEVRYGGPTSPELIAAHVANRIPVYPRTSEHWLIPDVGTGNDRLPPLLLWWALAFGLSLLARYQPAEWRNALDLDRSACADPLIELLDEALAIVPNLLADVAIRD